MNAAADTDYNAHTNDDDNGAADVDDGIADYASGNNGVGANRSKVNKIPFQYNEICIRK